MKHPFPPLYDKNSRVLILGSFPSVKSREMMFFYGHPQNRFWKVIASIKNAKANDLSEILDNAPIQKIIVNGKTAERLYIKYIEPVTGIKAVVLPSTSPANAAWSLERLIDVWGSEIKN